jgi:ribosomal protein S18 acetylase RimI-like enzyme
VITSRPAQDLADLRLAESVLSSAWLADAPFVASHPGDLEWWYASAAPAALPDLLRLWDVDGSPAAWSWTHADQVHWEIWTGDPATDGPLLATILEAAVAAEGPHESFAWAPETDHATLEILGRSRFRPAERRLSQFQRRVDDDSPIPDAALPDRYRIRSVSGPHEVEARMALHRAAFAPSKMTVEKYERLTTLPHYRFEDDLVVEAPDGSLAAFAMAWWDPIARVGEYEPVGTHPDHQRRGLGRALLTHGLRRYRDLGARLVQVYSNTDNAASEGLYQAVGFARRHYRRQFERRADPDVRSVP